MMIFPKKTPQDRAPQEAAPVPTPSPPAQDCSRMPDTWRVVLEDGSTSGESAEGPTGITGRKLMTEVTDAISGRFEPRSRHERPRSIAMPSSSRPPLQALGQPFGAKSRRSSPGLPKAAPPTVPPASDTPCNDESARQNASQGKPKASGDLLAGRSRSGRRDLDARLARLIDLWPQLPRNIQAAIMNLADVDAA